MAVLRVCRLAGVETQQGSVQDELDALFSRVFAGTTVTVVDNANGSSSTITIESMSEQVGTIGEK